MPCTPSTIRLDDLSVGLGGFTLLAGGRYVCTPAWSLPAPEDIRYLRVYVTRAGSAECHLGGRWHRIAAGMVHLIPPGTTRRRCAARMEVDWVHALPDSPVLDLQLAALAGIVRWPIDDWDAWSDAIDDLQHGVPRTPAAQLRVEALIAALVAAALAGRREAAESRFDPVLRWLDQHAMRNPPLTECARVAGLSPIHFHRAFTRATGLTPHAYIQRRRLRYAQELLLGTALPVAEVASRCGFPDPFYFSRVFRRAFGTPPRSARAQPRP